MQAQTIRYVDDSAGCNLATHHDSLPLALLASTSSPADEIRLTDEVTYSNLALSLTNFEAGLSGNLTIAGGYSDCNDTTSSGRTTLNGQAGLLSAASEGATQLSCQLTALASRQT